MVATTATFGRMRTLVPLLPLLLAMGNGVAQTQWTRVDIAAPNALADEQLAFDEARGVVVLFGGTALPNATPYHLAEWDGAQWLVPPLSGGAQPSGRARAALAFDAARGRLVVFGGRCEGACPGGAGPVVLDETWEYSGTWTRVVTAVAPSPRYRASLAFDRARARCVLFGGTDGVQPLLAETWEYDGTAWLQRAPLQQPPANGPMEYAPPLGGVALALPGQLWHWDGGSWNALPPAGTPSDAAAIAWDGARAVLVLYSPLHGAPYEWDGVTWTLRAAPAPVPDVSFAMCYDAARRQVVWTSTLDLGTPTFRDTWSYAPVHAATVVSFGSACASPTGAPDLHAAAGSLPWLGATFDLEVTGVSPQSLGGFLAIGSTTVPPFDLAPLGWPGCRQYVAVDRVEVLAVAAGAASWSALLPQDPALVGAAFHLQALLSDAAATGGAVVTNALTCTVGAR